MCACSRLSLSELGGVCRAGGKWTESQRVEQGGGRDSVLFFVCVFVLYHYHGFRKGWCFQGLELRTKDGVCLCV